MTNTPRVPATGHTLVEDAPITPVMDEDQVEWVFYTNQGRRVAADTWNEAHAKWLLLKDAEDA